MLNRSTFLAGLAVFFVFHLLNGSRIQAQSETLEELRAIRKSLDEIKQEQAALKKGLEEIRGMLSSAQRPAGPPKNLVVSLDDDPVKGDRNAKLTLIEFSDYQCPFCARAFRQTLPLLDKEYIQTGKLKYVIRDFPLSIHKEAPKAAEAANCAGDQNMYWAMHDRLFTHQNALRLEDLPKHAQAIGLDRATFQQCLDSGKHAAEIRKDMQDGAAAGVRGTPTFFLGVSDPASNQLKVQKQIVGAQSYQVFKAAIDQLSAAP